MKVFIDMIRNVFFTDIHAGINLYMIISSIIKFIFVFIVLYYISTIVKMIILDIKTIQFNKQVWSTYLIITDKNKNTYTKKLENYNTIGRNIANNIVLDDDLVSNFHAEIIKSDDDYYIIDKDSLNGIYINGTLIDDNLQLLDNDKIQIGEYTLIFHHELAEKENGED